VTALVNRVPVTTGSAPEIYTIDVPASQPNLIIKLSSSAHANLYVALGVDPVGLGDGVDNWGSSHSYSPQAILIPTPAAGTYHILISDEEGASSGLTLVACYDAVLNWTDVEDTANWTPSTGTWDGAKWVGATFGALTITQTGWSTALGLWPTALKFTADTTAGLSVTGYNVANQQKIIKGTHSASIYSLPDALEGISGAVFGGFPSSPTGVLNKLIFTNTTNVTGISYTLDDIDAAIALPTYVPQISVNSPNVLRPRVFAP